MTPYVGLRPYRPTEHEVFHGRSRESREVATLWQATGLTVLYGASGVGKTSLLHAGVVPRLDDSRVDRLPIARIAPRDHGPGNPYVMALLSCWAPDTEPARLAELTVSQFLREIRPTRLDEYGDPMPVLAAIDQAEELFHGRSSLGPQQRELLGQLAEALAQHDRLHLLLSLREEFLYMVIPYERAFGRGSRTRFHLLPFTPEAALEAVTGPVAGTGRHYAPGAAELLIDGVREAGLQDDHGLHSQLHFGLVDPFELQINCAALWESLPDTVTEIQPEHTRIYGNVDRFLTGYCNRALSTVAREHGVGESDIRMWLRRTFITEHTTRNTVYEGIDQTQGMPNEVAHALVEQNILRTELRLNLRWYELRHDRLIETIARLETPDIYLRRARRALEHADWDNARRYAREAVRASAVGDPWVRGDAAEIFGLIAMANADPDEANRYFDEAAASYATEQRFDGVSRVLTAQGKLALAEGDRTVALERINAALSYAPADPAAQLALAQTLMQSGVRAASAVLRSIITKLPPHLIPQAEELLSDSA
ncbi:hypothetical protein [Nonomuraea sp. NPDC050310]|uniref:tetratricopeptide repeat protein n=1 Tax=Nonomuraea sp. NPDC050310 TaxID=3154935 RepID=UPI0033C20F29